MLAIVLFKVLMAAGIAVPVCSTTGKYYKTPLLLANSGQKKATNYVPVNGRCVRCLLIKGPVCSLTQTWFASDCQMIKNGQVISRVYKPTAKNTCQIFCDPLLPRNPVCDIGGVVHATNCALLSAKATRATNFVYDPKSDLCVPGFIQDRSAFLT